MTNFEKWKEIIGELNGRMAIINGVPCECDLIDCGDCDFIVGNCEVGRWLWLWEVDDD